MEWGRIRRVSDQFADDWNSEKQTSALIAVGIGCPDQYESCKRKRDSLFEASTPDYRAGVIEDCDFESSLNR